jgi:hypothetical protein
MSKRLRKITLGRVLCFDLENRPSAYWYDGQTTSQITAFGWKWLDEKKAHTFMLRADGMWELDEGGAYASVDAHRFFRDTLLEAGLVYGHNIRRHDLPIFQAWLLRHQLEPLPPILTTDTLRDYPKRKDMSASLANLVEMYGVKGSKFGMTQHQWEQANQLLPDGIETARKRVVSDVLLQERLRLKLLELGLLGAPRMWG